MITKSRFSLTAATVLMVLVFSAMWTVPAFADDSTPPPTETPTEVVPPVDEEAVEPSQAELETPATEEPVVVVEETVPTEPIAALTEVLEQLPEGTDVQVVDENGETLPLVTQAAADVVAAADPIWCPSTVVTPVAGGSGCSPSYTSFNDLLNWLAANQSQTGKAGTIWIEKNYNSSTANGTVTDVGDTSFTLDGLSLTTMANFALTIKGGWNGIGTNTVNTSDQSEFNGASLSIINWKANVTISDVLINGAVIPFPGTSVDSSALLVETTGNIQLTRVTVKDSEDEGGGAMTGATLDNRNSTTASTVIVNNGVFEKNEGDGLRIYSTGIVTITSIIADGNKNNGVIIDNTFATMDRAVTLNGTQEYHNNGTGSGLSVISKGLVTISNVMANGNGLDGVHIDNHASLTNQGVTVSGVNTVTFNAVGLNILSHGIITTYNIFASQNGSDGARLDNCDDAGGCSAPGTPGVNLYGNNYFYGNGMGGVGDGLSVTTLGQITAYNLIASNNSGNGVYLDNQLSNLASVDSSGGITLYGNNIFNTNLYDGLFAVSHGDIIAYNLTASDNYGNGVSLTTDKVQTTLKPYVAKVKVKGKTKSVTKYYTITEANIYLYGPNKFSNNSFDGLYASADGMIVVYNISADFNGENGADLNNTTQGYGISLYGTTNSFTENGCSCVGDPGLLVRSAGAVTLYNIIADGNYGNGVDIDNTASSSGLGVTLYGTNMFNGNATGLNVVSHGIITTYNLSASGNEGDGVHLDNCDVASSKCTVLGAPYVYMVGNNYFYFNGEDGLDVSSFGQIITYNLTASYNGMVGPLGGSNGVRLNNQWFNSATVPAESVGTITLYGSNVFNMNFEDGLNATSSNNIVTYNLTANNNLEDGVSLSANKTKSSVGSYVTKVKVKGKTKSVTTYYTITAANVTLYGNNNFSGNSTGDGLNVSTDGAINVYNLTANGNGQSGSPESGNGVTLDNCTVSTGTCNTNIEVNPVTIYGFINVSGNNWRGLQINSSGAITLSNIIASRNLGVGVRIDNKFNPLFNPAVVRGVTITGTNIFNDNDSTGLFVRSYGAITLANINAYYNGDSTSGSGSGAYLENSFDRDPINSESGIVAKAITITGVNSFIGNYTFGLKFVSNGIVTLSRISANGNDWDTANGHLPGENIGSGVSGTARYITLTCGHMYGNGVNDPGRGYDLQVGLAAAGTAPTLAGVLTINGIYSAGNGNPVDNVTLLPGSPTPTINRPCALP